MVVQEHLLSILAEFKVHSTLQLEYLIDFRDAFLWAMYYGPFL